MAHRKYLIAGNWKMNISSCDVHKLVSGIIDNTKDYVAVDILICPPFTSISSARTSLTESSHIFLGAQNLYPEKSGAFTGEVSAIMLRELGVSHVIVGHSERRSIFNESDQFINKKMKYSLANNLIPILCVGETLEQRQSGNAMLINQTQITEGLKNITVAEMERVIIAYEPVWAIGTGETATPILAQEMHSFIRDLIKKMFNSGVSDRIKILYGGSMKSDNAKDLLAQPDVDGGLIGGASLKVNEFSGIVSAANNLSL